MSTSISAASLQPEQWTTSANEAVKLFVTDATGAINFSPTFTYPIFGDAETIYGYKDLVIFLCFDHFTFKPFFNVKYSAKLDDPDIVDLEQVLRKFLPESAIYKDESKWADSIQEEKEAGYTIPGELIDSFEKDDSAYEIYKINVKDASGLELHKRLQILVLLFIEAGSYIDTSDELWDLYVLYNKDSSSIVGFATAYNYWKYPGSVKFDDNKREIRKKISQFIILPIYQGKGLGGALYSHLFDVWHKDEEVVEVVVEDPNESFDDMRDRADLSRLNKVLEFSKVTPKVESSWVEETRKSLKLEKRQFSRLLELILLYKLKHSNEVTKKDVRLFIKKRLYNKNKEGLSALDENTKKDKLQTAYEALEDDYYRILGDLRLSIKRAGDNQNNGNSKKAKVA
ncbi:histone acetyltransferase type B catalytic subunit [Spathaspora passalidarum NRRL Y-27907]|uniref:Histone acetyltransferase type B catalytic subunit n=1 Tax=Spathaspora passalidarum (strain NRRL Y-27907 / 11-Y1) TaxID=619300 RepID=G3AFR4_SPAPN|nr:histone acetyltransferase type B catalytic subunit [Spathaspora passalidarum NRRL Y-27907]EGW35053.1 histone acetyltransferase type B catalytic subunit [Spathaspora passalidarum NRRL Y-27907]